MLLRKIDYLRVGTAKIVRQLMDEEPRQLTVAVNQLLDNLHWNCAHDRRLHCNRSRNIRLVGEICPMPEILNRTDQADNLLTTAYSFLVFLNLSLQQAPQIFRSFLFCINDLVTLVVVNGKIINHNPLLLRRKDVPNPRHVFLDYFF